MDQPIPIQPIPAPTVPQPTGSDPAGFKWLFIALFSFLLGIASVFAYQKLQSPKPTGSVLVGQSPLPLNTPAAQLPISSSFPEPANIFLISLELKSPAKLPPLATSPQAEFTNLAEYLNQLLKLPEKTITQVYYEIRDNVYNSDISQFNSDFYIHFNQAKILENVYEDQYLKSNVQPAAESLLPYLIKSDYCEQDSDCALGGDMCTYGAFNYYRKYYDPPWGCGPGGYKSNYSWFKWGEHDDQLNCEVQLKFDGAECVNNQCLETGYQKECI